MQALFQDYLIFLFLIFTTSAESFKPAAVSNGIGCSVYAVAHRVKVKACINSGGILVFMVK